MLGMKALGMFNMLLEELHYHAATTGCAADRHASQSTLIQNRFSTTESWHTNLIIVIILIKVILVLIVVFIILVGLASVPLDRVRNDPCANCLPGASKQHLSSKIDDCACCRHMPSSEQLPTMRVVAQKREA